MEATEGEGIGKDNLFLFVVLPSVLEVQRLLLLVWGNFGFQPLFVKSRLIEMLLITYIPVKIL